MLAKESVLQVQHGVVIIAAQWSGSLERYTLCRHAGIRCTWHRGIGLVVTSIGEDLARGTFQSDVEKPYLSSTIHYVVLCIVSRI